MQNLFYLYKSLPDKIMRPSLFFIIPLLIVSNNLFSQNKSANQIASIEKQRFEAMTEKNIPFLENVLHDEVTYAHSNGLVESRQQHLENIKSEKIVYKEMDVEKNEYSSL